MAYVEATDIQEILDSFEIRAAELARQTHVSRSYLSHLMNGRKSNPSALWALQVVRFCREEGLKKIAERIDERVNSSEENN
jgi:hypothetical protein